MSTPDMRPNIYFDYAATSPCDPRVVEAMLPYFTESFGNPGSRNHGYGWEAERGIETARRQVADLIGADRKEIVFTSGATESNNLALKGVAYAGRGRGDHIVTSAIEHPAILATCGFLERSGFKVTYCDVDEHGVVHPDTLREAITDDTVLVSVMTANNETGTIQPIRELLDVARERGVRFYPDAPQATGQGRLEIVPTSDSSFALRAVEASVTFHRNADGEVDALTMRQGGGENRATRLADDAEEEWAPTVEDLGAFVGRYFSQELETFYTVTLEEDQLVLQQRRMDDRNLNPGAVDTFAGGGLEVSFERDRDGRVIGLYMSSGRTRGVRFERVN